MDDKNSIEIDYVYKNGGEGNPRTFLIYWHNFDIILIYYQL